MVHPDYRLPVGQPPIFTPANQMKLRIDDRIDHMLRPQDSADNALFRADLASLEYSKKRWQASNQALCSSARHRLVISRGRSLTSRRKLRNILAALTYFQGFFSEVMELLERHK